MSKWDRYGENVCEYQSISKNDVLNAKSKQELIIYLLGSPVAGVAVLWIICKEQYFYLISLLKKYFDMITVRAIELIMMAM